MKSIVPARKEIRLPPLEEIKTRLTIKRDDIAVAVKTAGTSAPVHLSGFLAALDEAVEASGTMLVDHARVGSALKGGVPGEEKETTAACVRLGTAMKLAGYDSDLITGIERAAITPFSQAAKQQSRG